MNSNTFLNRVEILLYSSLISAMSGLSNLRAHLQHSADLPAQPKTNYDEVPTRPSDQGKGRSLTLSLISIREALISLFLWIILGFAAGFLIGMIHPG